MNILIIGSGYVGTTTGLVFCEMGHHVTGLDIDEEKVKKLQSGVLHFFEPGLEELLIKHTQNNNITFTTNTVKAIKENDIIFICVGTPQGADGSADLGFVKGAAKEIGKHMENYKIIVNKSTVPVGTAESVSKWIKENQKTNVPFDVLSNPEFLREGSALNDALNPDRVVIGSSNEKAGEIIKALYKGLQCPIIQTSTKAAELIKYASNSFLALKISYINELSRLAKKLNIHIDDISEGVGLDHRIGKNFLKAGIGYGGSCFPKDISALLYTAYKHNAELSILNAAKKVNETQHIYFIKLIRNILGEIKGKTIAVLGLAFKANTDDTRESPAIKIINELVSEGANVTCYDPIAKIATGIATQYSTIEDAIKNCDAVIICTEWQEFQNTDWEKQKSFMKNPIIIDGRNILEKSKMEMIGFNYYHI